MGVTVRRDGGQQVFAQLAGPSLSFATGRAAKRSTGPFSFPVTDSTMLMGRRLEVRQQDAKVPVVFLIEC